MQRFVLNEMVGHVDLWTCDAAELPDLGGKFAPALPSNIMADRRIRPALATLEALRAIATMTGQRIVSVCVKTLARWHGRDPTETTRRKIRYDLLRLAKCGVLDRGVRETHRGRTMAVAVRLMPVCFLTTQCPPESRHGMTEMMPLPYSEAKLPPSFEGGEVSPPITDQKTPLPEPLSDYDDPYPDAAGDSFANKLTIPMVAVGNRDPVDKLDKRNLTFWKGMDFPEFVGRNKLGTRSGKVWDVWEELTEEAENGRWVEPWDHPDRCP